MVRTLDFHSKNVGSSPASLILRKFNPFLLNQEKVNNLPLQDLWIFYRFRFKSLIAPFNSRGKNNILQVSKYFKNFNSTSSQKIFFKNSYLVLTWLYYLSSWSQTIIPFNSKKLYLKKLYLKAINLPKKRQVITYNRAPMAHKDNSKEQFSFCLYNFTFTLKTKQVKKTSIYSLNNVFFFILQIKKTFPVIETSVFFLKSYTIIISFTPYKFYNLFKFKDYSKRVVSLKR